MFSVAFHKQAVSAPLLTGTNVTALTPHQLVSVIDAAMQEVAENPPKKLWLAEAVCCAFDPSQATLSPSQDSNVWVVVSGALTKNCMRDVRELYGLPSHDAEATSAASASLLLELYDEGFADSDGDYTDQPATALGILEGTMSFVLYDMAMQYMLVHRCPGADSTPLFWGPDRANGQVLLLSTQSAAHLSPFPPGCAFESRMEDGEGDGWSRMLNVSRHSPSARVVNSVPKVNSKGALCGMIFKSQSGRDLMTPGMQMERDVY